METNSIEERCDAYNEANGTDYTPESYEEANTRVEHVIAWDAGWRACEKWILKRSLTLTLQEVAELRRTIAEL